MRYLAIIALLWAGTLRAQVADFNLELVSQYQYSQELSDIWGYVDEQGTEYALVGLYYGFSIVSLADPADPQPVFQVAGFGSAWRDIKTWGDYAYVTCESPTKLLIVDMSPLPESTTLPYTYWQSTDTMSFSTAHNLYIDEEGIAYIFGADFEKGGAIMLDLTNDPMDPTPIGLYDVEYLHDGIVRNDTLWGAAVFNGDVHVVDVSDKSAPQLLSAWKTPSAFTHNVWLSDDGHHLFTTDEVRNGSIASYDVENILNPVEMDVWSPNDTGIIPHNAHYINGYLVNSYYTIGVSILDVSRPGNMIEVGRYDTSPDYHYEGFHGCWGVYPWLPSGLIIASDSEEGLYVFEPTYSRACYLEGRVSHERTGASIFYPKIEIIETGTVEEGDIIGRYATGTVQEGYYTVKVSKEGFFPKTIPDVHLESGEVTVLDVMLNDWPASADEAAAEASTVVVPNPARDRIHVRSDQQYARATLMDLGGRIVRQVGFGGGSPQIIEVEDLRRGTYLLDLQGEGHFRQMVVLE